MKRPSPAWVPLLLFFAAVAVGSLPEERFPPKGSWTNSTHRFFPDLDARMNAVRYGRWRALEIAWGSGINDRLDQRFSSYLLSMLADPPRFAPEADRVAPRFAREAIPIFRALHWGQVFEQQALDILAASDASPQLNEERLGRIAALYRRERWSLSEPAEPEVSGEAMRAAPASARILVAGTRLFVLAAEDLAAADFGQQRWRVKKTVEDFDQSVAQERSPEQATYHVAAPTVVSHFPIVADQLDRLRRFRAELFEALLPGGKTAPARQERDERVRQLARRWGLPVEGIGGR
jgi:hypothetical protein